MIRNIFMALLLLKATMAFSQAGLLDSTFGVNGIATYYPGGIGDVKIQSDGKIIAMASNVIDWIPSFSVLRFNANGVVDSSFGLNGQTTVYFSNGYDVPSGIVLQPDGKILEGGFSKNSSYITCFGLARFNENGTIDSSFSSDGKLLTSFGFDSYGNALSLQTDGKIIEAGSAYNATGSNFAVVRYNSNGSLDNTFGVGGKVTTVMENPESFALCVAIQPDGKIVAGGPSSINYPVPCAFALARYNIDGSLDNSFGNNGIDTTYFGGAGSSGSAYDFDEPHAIALQPDGKILMTGESYLGYNAFATIPIVRYNTDGSLDNSFGNGGKVMKQVPGFNAPICNDIAIQQDGKILVTGNCSNNYHRSIFLLSRFLSDGTIDSSFGDNGFVFTVVDTSHMADNEGHGLALQQDGKIVVGGWSYQGCNVLRYLSGLNVGILNLSIPNLPVLLYPNPVSSQAELEYALEKKDYISINLYTLQGKIVQSFITNQLRIEGKHKEPLFFNHDLPAGNYLLSISNQENKQVIQVTLR